MRSLNWRNKRLEFMDKVKGHEVYWKSVNGNIVVTYNPHGIGSRFNIYRKKLRQQLYDPEKFAENWDYVISFTFADTAFDYAEKMNDTPVYSYIDDNVKKAEVIPA